MKISYEPKRISIKDSKLLIYRLLKYFNIDRNTIKEFIENYKKYKIQYISFSDNSIKIYLIYL